MENFEHNIDISELLRLVGFAPGVQECSAEFCERFLEEMSFQSPAIEQLFGVTSEFLSGFSTHVDCQIADNLNTVLMMMLFRRKLPSLKLVRNSSSSLMTQMSASRAETCSKVASEAAARTVSSSKIDQNPNLKRADQT